MHLMTKDNNSLYFFRLTLDTNSTPTSPWEQRTKPRKSSTSWDTCRVFSHRKKNTKVVSNYSEWDQSKSDALYKLSADQKFLDWSPETTERTRRGCTARTLWPLEEKTGRGGGRKWGIVGYHRTPSPPANPNQLKEKDVGGESVT